jgi:hypothetical protein
MSPARAAVFRGGCGRAPALASRFMALRTVALGLAMLGLAILCLAAPREALATEAGAPVSSPPSVRRSGIVVGISTGLALSRANGYPNDVAKIDVPEFEASTGTGVNRGTALWIGGALADWLTLSAGFSGGSYESNGLSASGSILHLRIDTFPLFWRGGPWQDLGVSFVAGTGNYSVDRGNERVAEGEATAAVGTGVFFEPIRFWHCSTGPELSYNYQFSRSISAHQFVVGWRLVLYGGP